MLAEDAISALIMGARLVSSVVVERGEAYQVGGDIFMHPITYSALRVSLERGEPMDSLLVQELAVCLWVTVRAERRESAACGRLDSMVRDYALRQERHHLIRWCAEAGLPHDYQRSGPDDHIALTATCSVCGQVVTDESRVRAGAR